jgi:hypothetical protein
MSKSRGETPMASPAHPSFAAVHRRPQTLGVRMSLGRTSAHV